MTAPVPHRRQFLRGTGAMIALPWLESLGHARAAAPPTPAKPPVRMACLFFPNGVWRDSWIPKESGRDYKVPFSLEPLGERKNDVLVLSNLDKRHSHWGDGHYAKTANFLTGTRIVKTTGKNISVGGISVDQLAASKLGNVTPLPSLELGIDPVISGIDSIVGFTRLYGSYISWRSPTLPVAREINPRMVYERLFGPKDAKGKPAGGIDADDDRSLLDLTLEDAKSLRTRLGRDDQFKLDEYLDAIRAVEQRIEFAAKAEAKERRDVEAGTAPKGGIPRDHREHVKLMLDLMVLAFRSDSTRVISFMFANDVSNKNFGFLDGVKGSHHDMSHHANDPAKIEQYRRINRWHVAQFAYLLDQLRSVKEGTGTLLDNSMILFGSGMSDGNSHDPNNLPILLGGRGGDSIETGRHIASERNTPLCNLYVSMLARMGTPVKVFGDSTGTLKGVG